MTVNARRDFLLASIFAPLAANQVVSGNTTTPAHAKGHLSIKPTPLPSPDSIQTEIREAVQQLEDSYQPIQQWREAREQDYTNYKNTKSDESLIHPLTLGVGEDSVTFTNRQGKMDALEVKSVLPGKLPQLPELFRLSATVKNLASTNTPLKFLWGDQAAQKPADAVAIGIKILSVLNRILRPRPSSSSDLSKVPLDDRPYASVQIDDQNRFVQQKRAGRAFRAEDRALNREVDRRLIQGAETLQEGLKARLYELSLSLFQLETDIQNQAEAEALIKDAEAFDSSSRYVERYLRDFYNAQIPEAQTKLTSLGSTVEFSTFGLIQLLKQGKSQFNKTVPEFMQELEPVPQAFQELANLFSPKPDALEKLAAYQYVLNTDSQE